jgi:hypothetical protein
LASVSLDVSAHARVLLKRYAISKSLKVSVGDLANESSKVKVLTLPIGASSVLGVETDEVFLFNTDCAEEFNRVEQQTNTTTTTPTITA